ncbi:MAG: amidohydrolase [Pseudomonadales bacterium]
MFSASRAAWLASLLFIVAAITAWLSLTDQPAKRAYINGNLLSMDDNNSIHQAVLIENGRIKAVGSNEEVSALIDKSTLVSDLNGKTMMPGIVDAHGHFPGSGLTKLTADLNSPPIGGVRSIAELQQQLELSKATLENGKWLIGLGYDDTLLAEERHPTRADLDIVSSEHPIFIMHVSGHMGVANSLALQLANINELSDDPPGGVIDKDDSGKPSGLLEENALKPIQTLAMDFGVLELLKLMSFAVNEYASMGVTTAQSGGVDERMYTGLRWASRLGLLKSRLVVFPLADSMGPALLAKPEEFDQHNSDEFTVGPIKIIADGSIQGYTGYLSQPYHVQRPNEADPNYRGYPRMTATALSRQVSYYHNAGLQMAIHGNGDASIDDIISAFDGALQTTPNADPRLILIHAQMARADQLDRFKDLGITPSFFSAHTYYWGDRHSRLFMGPDRAAAMSPAKWAVDRSLPFSIHLDTPVVPMQPFLLVWSAVNRISSEGRLIGADQRISTLEALRAITIDAAWQIFQDQNRGSIESGKWADLIVLSDDPLLNPVAIKDIQVLETVVAGRTIYAR